MASIRLTKDTREITLNNLIKHRFGAEEKALCEEARLLGIKVFHAVVTPTPEQYEQMLKAPEGWFKRVTSLVVHISNVDCPFYDTYEYSDGRGHAVLRIMSSGRQFQRWDCLLPEPMPIPWSAYNNTPRIDGNSMLGIEAEALARRANALREAREEAREKVAAILSQYTTVAKLVAAWPEVEPHVPGFVPPPQLPALPLADLNSMLGLP